MTAQKSRELEGLLQDIASLSDKLSYSRRDDDARRPSFAINRVGTDVGVRFAGIPMGHEFTSLVLALLQVGGHPSKTAQDVIEQVRDLEGEYHFETYFSLSCQNCPDTVQALNLMSVINPNIHHVAIDGALFQDEVERAPDHVGADGAAQRPAVRPGPHDDRADRRQARHRRFAA